MNNDDLAKKIQKAKDDVVKYEWCDCYNQSSLFCGCNDNHILHIADPEANIIHWLGLHWELECAFKHAIAGLDKAFTIFKYMDDEEII